MIAKYYVDAGGNYLGGFTGCEPPAGAVEVPTAPTSAVDKWNGAAWVHIPTLMPLTPRQIRLVLNAAGLRGSVESAVASASQDVKDMWEFSQEYKRDDPVLTSMAQQLGISDVQLDLLFAQGALL
jgi:hypothetical protein